MADFKNYDPALISIVFKGITIQGIADGTFVKVARDENSFTKKKGAGGSTVRVRNRNRDGTITLTIQAESQTNDQLSAIVALDESTGAGVGSVQVKNLNGTTLASSAKAWLVKPADVEYATDATDREWIIECHELKMLVGGALA
jgi:hypothetical protein